MEIRRAMGRHCLMEARKAGYVAMQFNFVVSTNTGAIALWRSWASPSSALFQRRSNISSLAMLMPMLCFAF
jgi:hypothetical protein